MDIWCKDFIKLSCNTSNYRNQNSLTFWSKDSVKMKLDNNFKMLTEKHKKYDYMSKLVIVGDAAVGKTNILLRLT